MAGFSLTLGDWSALPWSRRFGRLDLKDSIRYRPMGSPHWSRPRLSVAIALLPLLIHAAAALVALAVGPFQFPFLAAASEVTPDAYRTVAWHGWVPNAIVAEFILHARSSGDRQRGRGVAWGRD